MQVSILRLMNYRKKRQHNAKIRFHSQGLCRKGAVPLFLNFSEKMHFSVAHFQIICYNKVIYYTGKADSFFK